MARIPFFAKNRSWKTFQVWKKVYHANLARIPFHSLWSK